MIITSIENSPWQEGRKTDKKGIALKIVSEEQKIRGFGTCFSELGALALNSIPKEEKKRLLDELFDEDKCNFNFCRNY